MKRKKIHFIGIKGVGMTPLAIIAKEAGFDVTGCDVATEFITDKALKESNITVLDNFSPQHIEHVDLVITTGAHGGLDNPEVQAAKKNNKEVLLQGQAVGLFMEGKLFHRTFDGISVAGSHGKTTTTAMLATILSEVGMDPSYLIGTSSIIPLNNPGHFGKGKYFIAEADEYATEPKNDKTAKFLWQHPKIALFTNLELDHPDLYNSIEDLQEVFTRFASNLSANDLLVACGDDSGLKKVFKDYRGRKITYGLSGLNDYVINRVSISGEQTFFWVSGYNTDLGEFTLRVTGEHNALNALGATIVALELGIDLAKIKKALLAFKGTKRRSEFIGQLKSGVLLFDDYAHHPTEIRKTLQAFRQKYSKHKIICVFQPHTYSRTKKLFEEFIRSFSAADTVILMDIYASLREEPDITISSTLLAGKMRSFHKDVLFLPTPNDVIAYLQKMKIGSNSIIITMGAGDVYKIHDLFKTHE